MHTVWFDHAGWGHVADRYPCGVHVHSPNIEVLAGLVDGGDLRVLFRVGSDAWFDVEAPLHHQHWQHISVVGPWRQVVAGVITDIVEATGELVDGVVAAYRHHPDGDTLHLAGPDDAAAMFARFAVEHDQITSDGVWERIDPATGGA
jgi:hypothetical protein